MTKPTCIFQRKMSMGTPMPTKIEFVLTAVLFAIALGFIFMAYMIISGAGLIP